MCELNNVNGTIEPVAVGESEGKVELWSPDTEEWLGTTKKSVLKSFSSSSKVVMSRVDQVAIDGYVEKHKLVPDLIKIDTEGNDFNVLQGAAKTLRSQRPLIVFESWRGEERRAVCSFLQQRLYDICNLPNAGKTFTARSFLGRIPRKREHKFRSGSSGDALCLAA